MNINWSNHILAFELYRVTAFELAQEATETLCQSQWHCASLKRLFVQVKYFPALSSTRTCAIIALINELEEHNRHNIFNERIQCCQEGWKYHRLHIYYSVMVFTASVRFDLIAPSKLAPSRFAPSKCWGKIINE